MKTIQSMTKITPISLSNKKHHAALFSNFILIIFGMLCLIPFCLIISISLTDEKIINQIGYQFFPSKISFNAYKFIFANPKQIIDSYIVTILSTTVGTILSVLIMSLLAYPLSKQNYKKRKLISFLVFFTMLFNGGLVPQYILISQYLNLRDTFWVLILPSLVLPFHVIMLRTFFSQLPNELFESAKIDGCSEWGMFFKILLPLSKPALATVALLGVLMRWNEWFTAMLYINNEKLITLQYLLQRIMMNVELIKNNMLNIPDDVMNNSLPTESMRMAMAVVVAGPMLLVFPFFQKHFTKGLTVGAVKG